MIAPKLDKRSRQDVIKEAKDLARQYVPEWTGAEDESDPGHEMIVLFGRLMEILIDRINRVPDKNFLAFLEMVGIEQQPGKPAQVPVTFLLSKNEPNGGTVPAGTQVATTQTETDDAQVFETRNAFFATPAKLKKALNVIPTKNVYSELTLTDLPPAPETLGDVSAGIATLSETTPSPTPFDNILYLRSMSLFGREEPVDIALIIETVAGPISIFSDSLLLWKRYDEGEENWVDDLSVAYSSISNNTILVTLTAFTASDKKEVYGIEGHWLACQFIGDFTGGVQIPRIKGIFATITPTGNGKGMVDAAFRGTTMLDMASPFYPFGERPKYGDAFYLASKTLFSPDVASVTLDFTIDRYTDEDLDEIFSQDVDDIVTEIDWQYLNEGGVWRDRESYRHTMTISNGGTNFSHTTEKKDSNDTYQTITTEDGTLFGNDGSSVATVTLEIPLYIGLKKFNSLEAYWIRAIIRNKKPYGEEMFIIPGTAGTSGSDGTPPEVVGPTFIPPVVEELSTTITYRSDPMPLDSVVSKHNFEFVDHSAKLADASLNYDFPLFMAINDHPVKQNTAFFGSDPAVYMGFDKTFGDVFVSILFHFQDILSAVGYPGESGNPLVVWEYVNPSYQWRPIDVVDGTADLTSSGIVAFTGAVDSEKVEIFQSVTDDIKSPGELYWYRARLAAGFYDHPPVLRGIYLNSVMTENLVTRSDDLIVGSANGSRSQRFKIVQIPVLEGDVWVREPEVPSENELKSLLKDYKTWADDTDDITVLAINDFKEVRPAESETAEGETWVRWIKVPNFLASGSQSRHYTLDRVTGVLTFGDGEKGLLPPVGTDNIVLRSYRVGGGEAANRVAIPLAVKELKSSLPFIDKIFNVQNAVGGADKWSLEQTKRFGPQAIKNKGRAVTAEDYEWMTLQNFSQVARVKCLATRAPDSGGGLVFKPGAVALIIVPKGRDRFPQPPKGLLRLIESHMKENALGNIHTDIYAIGPEYVELTVRARVKSKDPGENSLVERRLVKALEKFFHPLPGGERGEGWEFGRDVYISEIYAVLERTEGVDYVDSVELDGAPGAESFPVSEYNLVASGIHNIQMV